MPYGTGIHTAAPSFRADGAGNKTREEKLKNKKKIREKERDERAHTSPKRDTLVSRTTSGLLPRNEPTTLLWPVFERKFPRETTVNKAPRE